MCQSKQQQKERERGEKRGQRAGKGVGYEWPAGHANTANEVNANRNARLACLAYAYCFYKTANNAQVVQCLPGLPSTSLPPPYLLYSSYTNGLRNVPFKQAASVSASTIYGFKTLCQVDYAIIDGICGLKYSIYVRVGGRVRKRSRWQP